MHNLFPRQDLQHTQNSGIYEKLEFPNEKIKGFG
jgi:hypothetical protein